MRSSRKAKALSGIRFSSAVLRPWVFRGTCLPLARALWAARAFSRFFRAASFCRSVAMTARVPACSDAETTRYAIAHWSRVCLGSASS